MKNKIALFLLATFLMSSNCNSKKAINVNRVWMLVAFKNYSKEDLTKNEAKLDLTKAERASAYMGCNNIGYAYSIHNNEVNFTQGMATKMYCDKNTLENDFLKTVEEKMTFELDGHFLILKNSKNETLKFVAQDWD